MIMTWANWPSWHWHHVQNSEKCQVQNHSNLHLWLLTSTLLRWLGWGWGYVHGLVGQLRWSDMAGLCLLPLTINCHTAILDHHTITQYPLIQKQGWIFVLLIFHLYILATSRPSTMPLPSLARQSWNNNFTDESLRSRSSPPPLPPPKKAMRSIFFQQHQQGKLRWPEKLGPKGKTEIALFHTLRQYWHSYRVYSTLIGKQINVEKKLYFGPDCGLEQSRVSIRWHLSHNTKLPCSTTTIQRGPNARIALTTA